MDIEHIKEKNQEAKSYTDWFEDGWRRNKGSIDDLLTHNKQLSENVEHLVTLVEKYEELLNLIIDKTHWSNDGIRMLAKKALKDS